METLQFVLDIMGGTSDDGDLTPRKGEAWRSIIRVRMLHAVARRRIIVKMKTPATCPVTGEKASSSASASGCPLFSHGEVVSGFESDALPINQEDLAVTLATFSVAPLWCLERFGHRPTAQEREDFMALWRHIGFFMGIREDLLARHFTSYEHGSQFMASVVMDMIPMDLSNAPLPPTIHILKAVSDRPPFPWSFEHRAALTRFLVGDSLGDALGLPSTTRLLAIKLRVSILIENSLIWFGHLYPRTQWNDNRIALLKESLPRMIRFAMGMRRTKFRPRTDELGERGYGLEMEEKTALDPKGAIKIRTRWIWLMVEMLAVVFLTWLLLVTSLCASIWALKRR